MLIFLYILCAILICFVTHEGGHWVAAFFYGHRITFRFQWGLLFGVIPIPRYVWYMPNTDKGKQAIIAAAGFLTEINAALLLLIFVPSFGVYCGTFALVHLILYKFYAGEDSDFKWI